ncbi:MAG: hypothetical protein ISS56_06035 [Anaerolineae bacterium]|nr:hypothetical protein [Anaerolineae bacterium]
MMDFGCGRMAWGRWGAWGGMGPSGHLLGLVLWVAVLALLVLAAVWLVRRLARRPLAFAVETPLDAARRRLAAGEITPTEFDQICDRLQCNRGSNPRDQ